MSATTGILQQPPPQTGPSAFQKLLDFLNRLDEAKFTYRLSHFREETVAVELAVPGERWEVEFFADGTIEVERFRSDGHVSADESLLTDLFTKYV
jgi:hypothetical protein